MLKNTHPSIFALIIAAFFLNTASTAYAGEELQSPSLALEEPISAIEGTQDQLWNIIRLEAKSARLKGDCKKLWALYFDIAIRRKSAIAYKARRELYNLILPSSEDTAPLIPPGPSKDLLSRTKHAIILAVHSNLASINNDTHPPLKLIEQTLPDSPEKASFLSCAAEDSNEDCSKILVEKNIVPDFEAYAKEVQILRDAGFHSSCGE